MISIKATYGEVKIFSNELELSAKRQIKALCEQPFIAGSKIRIMPDVHAGKGCTIGTTMTIGDYVVPNLVGVDIGCGMLTVQLEEKRINLTELDSLSERTFLMAGMLENVPIAAMGASILKTCVVTKRLIHVKLKKA